MEHFLFPLCESVVGVRRYEVSTTIRVNPFGGEAFKGAIVWGEMGSGCSSHLTVEWKNCEGSSFAR